eukprot:g55012.t1
MQTVHFTVTESIINSTDDRGSTIMIYRDRCRPITLLIMSQVFRSSQAVEVEHFEMNLKKTYDTGMKGKSKYEKFQGPESGEKVTLK